MTNGSAFFPSFRVTSPSTFLGAFTLRAAALVLGAVALVASSPPASARPHHHLARIHNRHAGRHAGRHRTRHRRLSQPSRWDDGVAQMQTQGLENTQASIASSSPSSGVVASSGFGSSDVVAEARRYIGGNPTGKSRLWCASFMNLVLERSGHRGSGSNMAKSFASYGQRVSGPQIGAIAVMSRHGGGHVGVVSGIDSAGNPIVVSGNHNHRVAEAVYPRGRIYAYVMPAG